MTGETSGLGTKFPVVVWEKTERERILGQGLEQDG